MTLKEKISKIKTDDLADITDIIEGVTKLESDLENANAVISERDAKITELQDQANRLYTRLILTETGGVSEEEEHEETLEEFNEKIKEQILGGN